MMKQILSVFQREVRFLIATPLAWFCMVAAPLLTALFFTTFMWQGLPTGMPIGVVDEDNTSTTRQLLRTLNSMQQTDISAQ